MPLVKRFHPELVRPTYPAELDQGLVGWWTFDDGTAKDISGNGNNGTLVNSPQRVGDTSGIQINGALQFNGTSNYVSLSNNISIQSNSRNFSVCAWAVGPNSNIRATIVARQNISNGSGWGLLDGGEFVSATNGKRLIFGTYDTVNMTGSKTTSDVFDGLPHFVAATWASATRTIVLYVDGVVAPSTASGAFGGSSPLLNNADPLTIGGQVGGSYFPGIVGSVRLYMDRVLSPGEIKALYNSAFMSSIPELMAFNFTAAAAGGFFSRYYYDMPAGNQLVA